VDEERHLDFKFSGEVIYKLTQVVAIFVVVILQGLFQLLIQVEGQVVVFVNSIQHYNPLLKFGILRVVVLEN